MVIGVSVSCTCLVKVEVDAGRYKDEASGDKPL